MGSLYMDLDLNEQKRPGATSDIGFLFRKINGNLNVNVKEKKIL